MLLALCPPRARIAFVFTSLHILCQHCLRAASFLSFSVRCMVGCPLFCPLLRSVRPCVPSAFTCVWCLRGVWCVGGSWVALVVFCRMVRHCSSHVRQLCCLACGVGDGTPSGCKGLRTSQAARSTMWTLGGCRASVGRMDGNNGGPEYLVPIGIGGKHTLDTATSKQCKHHQRNYH